jgi:hypothetical protein
VFCKEIGETSLERFAGSVLFVRREKGKKEKACRCVTHTQLSKDPQPDPHCASLHRLAAFGRYATPLHARL